MGLRHENACGENHFDCRCGMFVMRFGKHKNKTISQIDLEDRGREYLEWFGENVDSEPARSFVISYLLRFPNG